MRGEVGGDVRYLEVAVHDSPIVAVRHCVQDLREGFARLALCHASVTRDVVCSTIEYGTVILRSKK